MTALALTCVIADDHPAVLDSLSRVIEAHGITVLARVRDGEDAIQAIDEHRPVVAVVDLRMPGMSGMAVARRASDRTGVILYTGCSEGSLVAEALEAGVKGFVLKEAPLADVARAIQRPSRRPRNCSNWSRKPSLPWLPRSP